MKQSALRDDPTAAASRPEPQAPPTPDEAGADDSFAVDRLIHAWQGRLTAAIAPAAVGQAFADWAIHLLNAPGKQADLARKAARKALRLGFWAMRAPFAPDLPRAIEPLAGDKRFLAPEWQAYAPALTWQSFLFVQQWWHNATTGIRGADPRHLAIVHFVMRQLLDAAAPSNIPWLNPEIMRRTAEQGGLNLVRGAMNLAEDAKRALLQEPPVGSEAFALGRDVALTPGKVVLRNRLMELIQYAPARERVHAEPVLIIPAWIMKYYILDLSETNSLVRYLVERGHSVFMVSWKNPGAAERDVGLDDYLKLGALRAIEAVRSITPRRVHLAGYCLGGTLAAIATATLARDGVDALASLTLLAAQSDFSEAGELMLFINPSQVAYLEDMMWDEGYLDTRHMAGAFQLLRSNDLIWSTIQRQYMLGERPRMTDLMAWNADATRMPYRMHSEYLRRLFLDNDLAGGRYRVDDRPVSLADLRLPIFAVSTTRDHIAPWRSVYKITWLASAKVTFVLAEGGHNAGIVAPPGTARSYRIATRAEGERMVDPEAWLARASAVEGSWWTAWQGFLAAHSAPELVAPPGLGAPARGLAPLDDAPGRYVREP